jgi:hypothetical protein
MSETPRHDDEAGASGETTPIDTSRTQSVPSVPSPGEVPPPGPPPGAPAPGAPAYGPPGQGAPGQGAPAYGAPPASPPQNPFASPAEGAPRSPYAAPPAGAGPQPPYGAAYPPPPQAPGGYGAAPGYGTPGYGAPGYGQPGQGYPGPPAYGAPGYGGPQGYAGPYAPSRPLSGATIALLVVSGLATLFGGWGIPALILGIIAAARKDEPSTSASLTRWGWIALVACFVLAIVAFILLGALLTTFSTNNSFSSGA